MNADNHESLLESDIGELILSYIKEFDAEIIDGGLTLLLNCLTISSKF